VTPVATEPSAAPQNPDIVALGRRLDGLEERLARLELLAAEPADGALSDAMRVSYNPSRTTLEARSVQDALDEIALALKRQEGGPNPLGPPGEGLFQIKGKGKGGQGQGAQGKGPPPQGGPSGGQQGGGKGQPPQGGGGMGQQGGGGMGQQGGGGMGQQGGGGMGQQGGGGMGQQGGGGMGQQGGGKNQGGGKR
jgi:hypothetical protein